MAAGNPLVSIQLARAIAALAVALAHIAPEFGSLGLVSPLPAFAEGAGGVEIAQGSDPQRAVPSDPQGLDAIIHAAARRSDR